MTTRPWLTYLKDRDRPVGSAVTLKRAMNLVDRPYTGGLALVRNDVTGETWERRGGSWIKLIEARPRPAAKAPPEATPA